MHCADAELLENVGVVEIKGLACNVTVKTLRTAVTESNAGRYQQR